MNESAGAKSTSEMQSAFEKWYRFTVGDDMDIQTSVAWDNWQVAWNAALASLTGGDHAELVKALLSYRQCDEEGVECRVSRQAVHEAADAINVLVQERDELNRGKVLADGMANMIRGFIFKTVERETLDEMAAKYRKWEEDYCHRAWRAKR